MSTYIFNHIYVAVRNVFFVKIFIVRIVNIAYILYICILYPLLFFGDVQCYDHQESKRKNVKE